MHTIRASVFTLILGMVCLSFSSYAQEAPKRFKFGLMVAPTLNWLSSSNDGFESRGFTPNLNYGLFADIAFKGHSRYFFSTGMTLVSNGGRAHYFGVSEVNDEQYESSNEVEVRNRYLEVPLGFKLRSEEIGYSVFSGWFGFGTGFRVRSLQDRETVIFTESGEKRESVTDEDISDQINPVRLSLLLGLEWERKISGDTYFTFGFTLNNGLTNIYNGNSYARGENGQLDWETVNADGSANGPKLKATSSTLALHLGVYF
ncbi:PorT family protein [bacterium SCSIO 12741]|nr:PorT family protein [bacterium SCSIO 12741]